MENSYSGNVNIIENIKRIEEKISKAAEKSGRKRDDITLLAVTKKVPVSAINQAIECGIDIIGENYVNELVEKAPQIRCKELHMIGHLQSNKIKSLLPHITMLQTLDSKNLADKLQKELEKTNRVLDVLIEVNIGREINKNGIFAEEVIELVEHLNNCCFLRLRGLMCIPPYTSTGTEEKFFTDMFNLYIDIRGKKRHNIDNIDILSMGMSEDYEMAIEHGANLVRIGSAIFGSRS